MTPGYIHRLVAVAEYFQVELNGRYSTERIAQLAEYHRTTSLRHSIFVIIATAIPCLVTPILLDVMHLAEPSAGANSNGRFFVREGIMWWVLSFLATDQWGHFVSSLGLSLLEVAFIAFVTALGSTALTYALSTVIGFPVPFTMVMGAPSLVTLITVGVGLAWIKKLRTTSEARPQIVSLLKVWTCQCFLVGIYPGYFYIFTSLPSSYRLPFACMLPVIKVLIRNWLSRALVHLKDEMSEHVLLNADVFSALFVAYCMQTVPSVWTTAGLMAIDAAQIIIAVRDVNRLSKEVEKLRERIKTSRAQNMASHLEINAEGIPAPSLMHLGESKVQMIDYSSAKSALELASAICTHHLSAAPIIVQKYTSENKSESSLPAIKTLHPQLRKVVPGAFVKGVSYKYVRRSKGSSIAVPKRGSLVGSTILTLPPLERQLVDMVGRQLFFAEFLLLLNFVEVVIPVVYGKITSGAVCL